MTNWYESMSRTPIRDEWFPPPNSSFRRSEACPVPRYGAGIQRGRVAPTTPNHFQLPGLIFIPSCAGARRHERLVGKHVPDSDPGSIPAPAGDTNHRRPNNDSPGSQEQCSAGACPQPKAGQRPTGGPVFILLRGLHKAICDSGGGGNPQEAWAAQPFQLFKEPANVVPPGGPPYSSLRLLLDYTFCIGPARPCPAHRTTHYFAETHPSDEIASS